MGTMYRDHISPIAHRQAVPNPAVSGNSTYTFNDNFRDFVSGNNPLPYGTPTLVPGKFGNALSLDGTDDYLALPSRLGDSTDFTFAAWIRWNGGNNWQRIFDLGNGTASYLFLTPKSGNNTLRLAARLNNGTEQQLNATALTPGAWTHVAVTLNGDTAKLFVNGSLVHTHPSFTINPSQIGTESNFLGKSQFNDPLFQGLLDQVIFLDSALSDTQVNTLATSSPPSLPTPTTFSPAQPELPYSADLRTLLPSPSANLTFRKIAGPSWLTTSPDGSLFGIPSLAETGTHQCVFSITSSEGATSTITVAIPVKSTDLVARYAFDGHTHATAGNAHATASGNPGFTTGRFGQALNLDGSDDSLSLPPGIASSEEITVATWVFWNGGNNWQRLFDFGNGTDQYLFLTPRSASNTLRFAIKNGTAEQFVETTPLPTSSWVHLAATLGPAGGQLYLNGSLVASNPNMTLSPSSFKPTSNHIGRSQFTVDPRFNGRIDDLQIFHRTLTSDEILSLRYASPPTLTHPDTTLPNATIDQPYEQSLTSHASSDSGTLLYQKISGPAWLQVEPTGRISGKPSIGDSGTHTFRIRTQASHSLATDFSVSIQVTSPPNLIAHYEFQDHSLNTITNTLASLGGNPTYTEGLWDRALHLDGSGDFAQLPAATTANLTDTTIAIRFRWNGGTGWQRLFDFGNNSNQYLFLSPSSPSGRMRFAITTNGYANEQFIDTEAAPVGEWTHVAVSLSGNQGTLYLNGTPVDSRTITLDPANIAATLHYLGRSQFTNDPWLNGSIDDFRIYNQALTPPQIRTLAIPPPPTIFPPATFDHWAASIPFPPGQSSASSDPDGDLLPNLIEWLNGSDPLDPQSGKVPTAEKRHASTLGLPDDNFYLSFSTRIRKNRPGITLLPQASSSLNNLDLPESANNVRQAAPTLSDGDFEIITWYYKTPINQQPRAFIRLKVLQP